MRGLRIETFIAIALAGGALATALGGCSSEPAAKPDKICTPGAYVFCRCQDRQEGAKLCNETGNGFGKCEPCETDTNPEIIDPGSSSGSTSGGIPPIDQDGGTVSTKCGDGIVQDGEDCDDKNGENTDGCDTSCKLAGVNPPATQSCPGLEVHVWGGAHKPTITGSTPGSGNRGVTPTCTGQTGNSTTGAAAADRVFKVVAHKTGTLTVATTDTNYDNFLYVAEACSATNVTPLTCKNGANGPGGETLTVPVDAGKTYTVFVDGAGIGSDKEGNFRVTSSIP